MVIHPVDEGVIDRYTIELRGAGEAPETASDDDHLRRHRPDISIRGRARQGRKVSLAGIATYNGEEGPGFAHVAPPAYRPGPHEQLWLQFVVRRRALRPLSPGSELGFRRLA